MRNTLALWFQPNWCSLNEKPAFKLEKMRIAFVHNFCTHYTRGTFELLAQAMDHLLNDPELRGRMSRAAKRSIANWAQAHVVLCFLRAVRFATDISPKWPLANIRKSLLY